MDLKSIAELYDHVGPLPFAMIFMAITLVFGMAIVWWVLKSNNAARTDQREISRQLADTQGKLVEHVTKTSEEMRETIADNTSSNLAASTSNKDVVAVNNALKLSIDALVMKLGADPGCKMVDPHVVCQADKFIDKAAELAAKKVLEEAERVAAQLAHT